jgi:hypothetical protein
MPLLLASSLNVFAQPEIVIAPVSHLYLPDGFDSNDSVEVIVTGAFSNSCYSRNDVKVEVDGDQIDIQVTAIANEKSFPASRCSDMIVPYKEVVNVGNLQGGDYKVNVNNTLKDVLKIAEASSNSVDDNIYAAIEWVENKGDNNYMLHGWRYSNCIDLDSVKVISNNKDTLSILPVMKQLSSFCPMKMTPVSYPVKLDFSSMKMKSPLLHVRTMDGKSVNTIIQIEGRR